MIMFYDKLFYIIKIIFYLYYKNIIKFLFILIIKIDKLGKRISSHQKF